MLSNKEELFTYIIESFSKFKLCWDSDDNCSVEEGGSYTTCGLCFELSFYYMENFNELNQDVCRNLFYEIEEVLVGYENKKVNNDLADSLKGCFLENISQTKAGEESKKWMGKLSREFFDKWHVYP